MASTDTTPASTAVADSGHDRQSLFRDHLMTVAYLSAVGLGTGLVIGLIGELPIVTGALSGTAAGAVFGLMYLVVLLLASI